VIFTHVYGKKAVILQRFWKVGAETWGNIAKTTYVEAQDKGTDEWGMKDDKWDLRQQHN
jgi:hypothetical protein